MYKIISITMTLLLVLLTSTALAERSHGRIGHDRYVSSGDRIDRHLDRKGDRIEQRFARKADRAESRGKFHKADRMRNKGERISRHLDRIGNRIHAHHDNHRKSRYYRGYKHEKGHKHYQQHRHYRPAPKVVYRDYDPYNTYLGLVINQPGLWLNWGWYD